MRAINWIGNTLFVLLCLVCAALLGFLIVPRMLGYQDYVVLSGSMEPTLPVGSLTYVSDVPFDQVEEGDIIAYTAGDDFVTHRVQEVTHEGLVTKGDANQSADITYCTASNYVGTVIVCIPVLGYLVSYGFSFAGKIAFLAFGLLCVGCFIASVIINKLKKATVATPET